MKNFLFGAASSAHQVEGNNKHSDWWDFEAKILSKVGISSGIATNHYNLYEEDFTLAKQLGHNAHRFSIEWAKIEPAQGKIDFSVVEHYKKVIRTLHKKHITPIITLHHFTLPLWFAKQGGFLHKKNIQTFIEYAKFIINELKDENIKYIITINEPNIYAYQSYLIGKWPPQKKNYFKYTKVLNNLAEAHNKLYKELKLIDENFKISIAKNIQVFKPERKRKIMDRLLTKYSNYSWNEKFLNSTKQNLDFIGINYYFYTNVKFNRHILKNAYQELYPTPRKTDLNWPVYPKGIYKITKHIYKKYNLPIIITENGIADDKDKLRQSMIKETLEWLFKAKEEGVNITGYIHWSLTDNYEWDSGFKPRFGLIKIDYNTLARLIRPSALLYKTLIEKYQNKKTLH